MKPSFAFKKVAILVAALPASAFAVESAADMLMKSASPKAVSSDSSLAESTTALSHEAVQLNTPIARAVFAEWNSSRNRPSKAQFEVNSWLRLFLAEKYEAAAHLWGAVLPKFPDSFVEFGRAAHLYSLYRLGLNQSFFDEWMSALSRKRFLDSAASVALEETLVPNFEAWLTQSRLYFSPDARATISKIGNDRSVIFLSLNAAVLDRKGIAGASLLPKLPVNSAFRPRIAQSVAIALARGQDLSGAAKVLKEYYEPWLLTAKDPVKTSSYYLQIARLLYQAGSMEGAQQYYEKIPNGSPDFLTAREELAWVWLRQGDTTKLRGTLQTLTSKLLEDQFQPEAYLVRSISNLKLCFHGEVEKDFNEFLKVNQKWAEVISKNMSAADPASPRKPDQFTLASQSTVKAIEAEIPTLEALSERSIAAVLPAVGPQKHWTEMLQKAKLNLDAARKIQVSEFRRQWKNDQATLTEAIRKMQFVKVELMSQMMMLQTAAAGASEQGTASQVAAVAQASGNTSTKTSVKAKIRTEGDLVFPFDGVIWPDELFKLRAQASSQCLNNKM